ncbi:MAG: DUF1822 family protein [Cyanobacteria bacterium P01_A01_bin.84]
MSIEFERLLTETILLEHEDINRAVEISNQVPNYSCQWETYLNTLALSVFKKWLQERDDTLNVDISKSTFNQPSLATFIPNIANLQVGEFKVCLITIPSLLDEQIPLSRIVVDIPEFVPHFYILVEVLEEQECGVIKGFISYPNLLNNIIDRIPTTQIESPRINCNYQIPFNCFENDPNHLLLYLRALESNAIALPTIPANRRERLVAIEEELVSLIPQLIPQLQETDTTVNIEINTEISQVLNWEQITAIVTNSELVDWIYQLQVNQLQVNQLQDNNLEIYYSKSLRDLIKLITRPAINMGRWLWDELDEVGQQLSWTLLPTLASATAFRSPLEEFEAIKTQLENQGVEIPIIARCGYNDFLLAGTPLRLYAIAWNSSTENEPNSWSLLLILGAPIPNTLPDNLRLRVSDQTGILVEQGINSQQVDSYLFTSVAGNWDEKFLVTASLGDDITLTLPPFAFDIKQ